jgi:pyrroline-5-carboxylate reductase
MNSFFVLKKHKINFIEENVDLFDHTDTIMICLKPKDVLQVLNRVSKRVDKSHLMLSLAADIQIKQIEQVYKQTAYKKAVSININFFLFKN